MQAPLMSSISGVGSLLLCCFSSSRKGKSSSSKNCASQSGSCILRHGFDLIAISSGRFSDESSSKHVACTVSCKKMPSQGYIILGHPAQPPPEVFAAHLVVAVALTAQLHEQLEPHAPEWTLTDHAVSLTYCDTSGARVAGRGSKAGSRVPFTMTSRELANSSARSM